MAYEEVDPRLRVSKITSLNLTTAWQKIDFDAAGGDARNINTFGVTSAGVPMVTWDTVTKLFKVNYPADRNFLAYLLVSTTSSLLTLRGRLQYQVVVPDGVSAGVPLIYPFTDQGAYGDIDEVTLGTYQLNKTEPVLLYASTGIRTNGFYINLRLSNVIAGTCVLNYCAFLIQGSSK